MEQVGGGCLGWSTIVYMSSGMFRGKESLNRIELSWLVQDLLNFGVLGSLWLWEGGRWVGAVWGHLGAWGCPHMHTHAHTHVYMYRNCKWLLTWRHPCLACLACLTCMCMCACIGHSSTHPYPPSLPFTHLPPCQGADPWKQLKFNNTWTNQDISIPFKDLKCVMNFPPMGRYMVWWVGGWLGGLMGGVRSNH